MTELLRAYDPNAVRRNLRDLLYDIHFEYAIDRATIPHTYDTNELLDYAERMTRRRDLRGSELHHQLMFRTGVAHCVVGNQDTGHELFEKGIKLSDYPPDQALFRYGIAMWIHGFNGGKREARETLIEARRQSERGRKLRTEIDLALGNILATTGDPFGAQQRYERILRRGVLELRPAARIYNVEALAHQGLLDEAWAESERAAAMLRPQSDWQLWIKFRSARSRLLTMRGETKKAIELFKQVVDERHRRLDVSNLARTYSNYAMLLKMQGRVEEALEVGLDSVRLTHLGPAIIRPSHYRNLALTLKRLDRWEAALGAVDTALEVARERDLHAAEFSVLVAAMEIQNDIGERDQIPAIVARCKQLLEGHSKEIQRKHLEEFVEVTGALDGVQLAAARPKEIRRVCRPGDRPAFQALVGSRKVPDFDRKLRSELGDGLAFEDAPEPAGLSRFLMLFTGDHFKSMSYQREFGKSQPRAKYHLQALVQSRVLERLGTRKASTYILAFHRT